MNIPRKFKQSVLSCKRRIFVEKYLTKTGLRHLALCKTKAERIVVWMKFGKNRFRINPDIRIIKVITHY